MSPRIRRALPSDAAALSALKRAAFHETFVEGFGIPYPAEDLAAFFAARYSPATVAAEIADPDQALWVVDAEDHRLIGYAGVMPCKLPHADARPEDGEISQLYLLNAAQGLGLGRRLMQRALDHLATHRPGPVWLGVWSGNAKAQAFYAAWGFEKVGEYDFPVGRWIDREYVFRRG